jgi:hypothetical protein
MIATTATQPTPAASTPQPDAVVWVDEQHAIVARADDGGIATTEVRRFGQPETRFLANVVHEIIGREHVMIVGPQPIRIALERAFVAISHRPDRLIAVPRTANAAGAEILDRLERLAA